MLINDNVVCKKGENMKRFIVALIIITLSGCSTVHNVLPISGDTYSVTTSGHYTAWSKLKASSVQRARSFCESNNKQMAVVGFDTHGVRGWSPQEAELTFNCLPTK